jgi:hypothetical protein
MEHPIQFFEDEVLFILCQHILRRVFLENIVAYLLKVRTMKTAETAIARERLCRHAC